MQLIGLMPVRNEAWILGLSARVALLWVDHMVFLDHASTDATRAILDGVAAEYPGRVTVLAETAGVWAEMAHRQRLLDAAREAGATHLALIDADELLTGDLLPNIRSQVMALAPAQTLIVPMRNMWRSIDYWRSDVTSPFGRQACATIAVGMAPWLAWRTHNGYDHHHREPYGSRIGHRLRVPGGVMHLQFASWRRLLAKHALYKITERIRWPHKSVEAIEALYNMAPNESGLQTTAAPPAWWNRYRGWLHLLDLDSEPWQEAEARRLLEAHGHDYFTGLSLFGILEKQEVTA